MTTILGVNAFHGDSSACVVRDGALVAAAEEERFRRIKHWAGFPSEAIRYCLTEAGCGLSEIDAVAINQDSKANLGKKLTFTLARRPDIRLVLDRLKNKRERAGVDRLLTDVFPGQTFRGRVFPVEHHLAHLSSAFHVSPFDEAVAVSVDGFGDFASGAWGIGRGSRIDISGRVYFPHSLGIFYQALTQYIGFPHYGDEYKVMGLAPYGQPSFLPEMRQIVLLETDGGYRLNLDLFRHHKEKIEYEWENGQPSVGRLYSDRLEDLLGPSRAAGEELMQRHKDIAKSIQSMYEEAFFHLLNTLHARHASDKLVLAGGCAMNSVANGKVRRNTPFREVYIQSAAGDAGGAIGAAFQVWHEHYKGGRGFRMNHAYWGPAFSNESIKGVLDREKDALERESCSVEYISEENILCQRTAAAIANGMVVGWFQGRMEWGPRALGNRSIVCDPRRVDIKDILNLKIKRRESFRPFAPSILREHVADWFEEDDDVPFMMKVLQIRPDKRDVIPAVTHLDGSGRLQTVDRHTNARYYRLIEIFREITSVPIVLNTSFNENEPVVCKPEEALACFLRTEMDVLVMGNWIVGRETGARVC